MGIDGWQAARRLKSNPSTRNIVVVPSPRTHWAKEPKPRETRDVMGHTGLVSRLRSAICLVLLFFAATS